MSNEDKFNLLLGLVAEFDDVGAITRGTMMGFPCLRVDGQFFACMKREGDSLIVKLPAPRVRALVEAGGGLSFAPAGRVFKEWLEVPEDQAKAWPRHLREALEFVASAA